MASPSPPSRVLSHAQPAHPSRVRLRTREGARKTLEAGRPREGSRAAPTRGAVGGCYGEVWIDSEKRERERDERARIGGKKRGKGAELTQAWALGAAVAVECGPATRNSSPGGRAGVGLPRRRLLPLVPPPPELRLPRKLIAT